MLKLFNRARGPKQKERNHPVSVYTALLSMVVCMVCLAGTSWAWFTANQDVTVTSVSSAQYGIVVRVDGEGHTQGQQEGNMCLYTLAPNQSYSITLTPAKDSTASTGYCLVSIGGKGYYTTPILPQTQFTFTCETGFEVPEGLTGEAYDDMVSNAGSVTLTVAWYWGAYPGLRDPAASETEPGYHLLENGAVLGTPPVEAPQEVVCNCEILCAGENEACPVCKDGIALCAGVPNGESVAPTQPVETTPPTEPMDPATPPAATEPSATEPPVTSQPPETTPVPEETTGPETTPAPEETTAPAPTEAETPAPSEPAASGGDAPTSPEE